MVNILKDGPVILNNQKCCGDFAIFAKRKGKNSVYVGNGSFVENKEFKVESENRGSFYMEYDLSLIHILLNLSFDQIRKYQYKTLKGTVDGYGAINADGDQTGYIMRKFVRNYAGQGRSDGDYHMPVMRLADVYLMYAEAANEAYGPTGDGGLALDVVNRVRHRGNLPALKPEKYVDKLTFFYAIEQERIVELFAEGQRFFDLRRWRSIAVSYTHLNSSPGLQTGLLFSHISGYGYVRGTGFS